LLRRAAFTNHPLKRSRQPGVANVCCKADWRRLVAMVERIGSANRDIFDVYFFLKNNWSINEQIIAKRTGLPMPAFLQKCIDALEALNNKGILSGLGELLDTKQKAWVREKLCSETVFLLKMKLENHTAQ
jgi:hypothetical protein